MKRFPDHLKVAIEECKRQGATLDYEVTDKIKCVIKIGNRTAKYCVSKTPSDCNLPKIVRRQIGRIIEGMTNNGYQTKPQAFA